MEERSDNENRKKAASFVLATVGLLLLTFWLSWGGELNHLGPDTVEYLEFSDLIIKGGFFNSSRNVSLPRGAVVRTPSFPLVLSFGRFLQPDSLRNAIYLGHGVLLVLSGLLLCSKLKRYCSPLVSVCFLAISIWQCKLYFNCLASEWLALMCTFLTFAAFIHVFQRRTYFALLLVGIMCALLSTIRPEFLTWVLAPVVIALFLFRGQRIRALGVVFVSLLPLWLLIMLNTYRIEYVGVVPTDGQAIFALASMFGKPQLSKGDRTPFLDFAELAGKGTHTAVRRELATTAPQPGFAAYRQKMLGNFYLMEKIGDKLGLSRVRTNELALRYALLCIQKYPAKYLLHLRVNTTYVIGRSAWLLPFLLITSGWIRRRRHQDLALATLTLFAFHFLRLLAVTAINLVTPRYFIPTYYPLVYACLLTTLVFAQDLLRFQNSEKSNTVEFPL